MKESHLSTNPLSFIQRLTSITLCIWVVGGCVISRSHKLINVLAAKSVLIVIISFFNFVATGNEYDFHVLFLQKD